MSLNAEDLRIGNTVLKDGKPKLITIFSLMDVQSFPDHFNGLSIDERVILDCGFEARGDTGQFFIGEQTVSFSELDGLMFWIMDTDKGIRCKYLHEFQNVWHVFKGSELNYKHS